MKKTLIDECKTIENNCKYTAEAHHILAAKNEKLSFLFQVVPAVMAAVTGGLALEGFEGIRGFLGLLSVTSACVAAVGGVLDPKKGYYDHLHAAKNFTVLKQDARALRETFSRGMNETELKSEVKSLHDRYTNLVSVTPPTDEESFIKAQIRIRSGVHEKDKIS